MKLILSTASVEDLRQLENNALFVGDTFDLEVLQQRTLYSHPKYVIVDHWGHLEFPGFDIHCLPLYPARIANSIGTADNSDNQTVYTFNFLVNKKQANRYMCLKLVEFFKLKNYNYTHTGFNTEFNMQEMLKELDMLGDRAPFKDWDRSFILEPSRIPVKYFVSAEQEKEHIGVRLSSPPHHSYGYIHSIIKNSAVSLITESNWGQRGSTFTEKTVFACLGLTLPIWIGGWQQATYWKRMGFDVFDDVIKHDYQNYETQIERFYYAFADNLELLTNFEKTAELREKLMPRLLRNQELLLNGQLIQYIKDEINNWPADLQSVAPELLNMYPDINRYFIG